jgi:hypothetical protein
MSKRRSRGDWVWLKPNSGFYSNSDLEKMQLFTMDPDPCCLCDDKDCREWDVVSGPPEPGSCALILYHVSECQMLDEPYCEGGEIDGALSKVR